MKKTKENINFWNNKPYSQRYYEILSKRKKLPAWEAREQLSLLLKEHQVIILQGETGSGKTTQIPQFLLESGYLERFLDYFKFLLEGGILFDQKSLI